MTVQKQYHGVKVLRNPRWNDSCIKSFVLSYVVKFSRGLSVRAAASVRFCVWSTGVLLHLVRAAGSVDPDWTGLEVS